MGSKKATKSKGIFARLGIPIREDLPRDMKNIYLGSDGGLDTQLVFDRVELKKAVIEMLAPPLILNHFGSIWFEYNQFGRHGILMIIDLMRCNSSLTKVFLIGNEIDNEEDISSMLDVISNHPSLKEVSIESCAGVNIGSNGLCSLLPASAQLTSLSLAGNNIKTNGSTIISDFLASNPALQELSLSRNKLNNDDAISIAAALKTNANLWKLDLTSNDIDRIGYQALCKAVFDPESLDSLSSCNHTCDISVSNCKIPSFHGSISKGTRAAAIKLKQFALISPPGNDGDVNVSLMGDTPLVLLHRVLFLFQAYPMKGDWDAIRECLDGKAFLESDSQNNDDYSNENEQEDSDDDSDSNDDSVIRELGGLGEGITEIDLQRIQKRDEQVAKTRSLSIMFNVMKDLVVPILFSV